MQFYVLEKDKTTMEKLHQFVIEQRGKIAALQAQVLFVTTQKDYRAADLLEKEVEICRKEMKKQFMK